MTIKELAYSAQQHLQVSTVVPIKRAHIYELMAASFGYNSYAALRADAVFHEQAPTHGQSSLNRSTIRHRCVELGYKSDVANAVSEAMPVFVTERQVGVIKIGDLIDELRDEEDYDHGDLQRCWTWIPMFGQIWSGYSGQRACKSWRLGGIARRYSRVGTSQC